MFKSFLSGIILFSCNLFALQLLLLLNSSFSSWGISVYAPSLFLFPSLSKLSPTTAYLVLALTGLCLDSSYCTPLGFHPFALILSGIILQKMLFPNHSGTKNTPLLIPCLANFFICFLLFLFLRMDQTYGAWPLVNFAVDLFFSTLLLVLVVSWFGRFCEAVLLLSENWMEKDRVEE